MFIITNNAYCDSIVLQNQNVSSFQHSYCPKILPVHSLIYSSVNLRELDPTCWIEAPIEDYLQGETKEQVNFQVNPATIKHFNETHTYTEEFNNVDNNDGSHWQNGFKNGFQNSKHGFVNHETNFLHIEITSPHDLSQSLKLHQKERKYDTNFLNQVHGYRIDNESFVMPFSSFLQDNGFINVSNDFHSFGFFNDPNLPNNFISLYGYETNDLKLYDYPPQSNEVLCNFFDITGKIISTQNCIRNEYANNKIFKMYELSNVHVHAKYIKMFSGETYSSGGKQYYSASTSWPYWCGKNRVSKNIQNVSHIAGLLYKYTDSAFKKEKEVKSIVQPLWFAQKQMFNLNIFYNTGYFVPKTPQEKLMVSKKLSNVPVPTKLSFLFLKIK